MALKIWEKASFDILNTLWNFPRDYMLHSHFPWWGDIGFFEISVPPETGIPGGENFPWTFLENEKYSHGGIFRIVLFFNKLQSPKIWGPNSIVPIRIVDFFSKTEILLNVTLLTVGNEELGLIEELGDQA